MSLRRMNRLVMDINAYNTYLAKFRDRESLDENRREDLVQCQREKAILVEQLKMTVKNISVVPKSVLEIYF
uniref:AsIV-cont00116-ORF1 n=1 Tax=Apophua simplicipes ichnovirus TaxID=1329648 RepID=S5DRC7_9VIRU|nr:AsIV-cont00116-ORF1 [Apophua simplicipes ichnovirus]